MKNLCLLFYFNFILIQVGFSKNPDKPLRKIFREVIQLPAQRIQLLIHKPQLTKEKVSYGKHERQYIYICYPEKKNGKVVFFVHGGGWHIGKPDQHLILAKILTEKGYIVVLPAYRLALGEHNVLTQREDIALAFQKSREKIETDTKLKWIIGGSSAGGNLSALLAFDEELQSSIDLCSESILGYFSLAGALDISSMRESIALKSYAGKIGSPTFSIANPMDRLPSKISFPSLIIQGTDDGLVDPNSTTKFCQKVCSIACNQLEFHFLNHYDHVDVTSKWYYKPTTCKEPREILLNWLEKISVN